MIKYLHKSILLSFLISLIGTSSIYAQSLAQAKKLYNEAKYTEAMPVFERLVKQAPRNSSYNLWYGVCCYKTGDLETAVKHLEVASKKHVSSSYLYLGEIYYQTYQFDKSIEMFDLYIEHLTKKKQETEPFIQEKKQAEDALRLMRRTEDIQIIDSTVIDKNLFLSAYSLSEDCGKVYTYQSFFNSNEPINTSVYINQKGDKIHFAYPTPENNYCLFNQSKLLNKWEEKKQLSMDLNTPEDDNYPFVLSDGVTMYFASKRPGGLGGYDLYITRYNIRTNSYLTPEQLGMPFNSPDNDYMLVMDEVKKLGWFVTDRRQPKDKVCVYLFIPNPNHKRIESEDLDFKRSRARIDSIKGTWLPDTNYDKLVKLAHKKITYGNNEEKKEFEFIINNKITYTMWADFKDEVALQYYKAAKNLKSEIRKIEKELALLRSKYANGNESIKEEITPSILKLEKELNELLLKPHEKEKQARNAELRHIQKKN